MQEAGPAIVFRQKTTHMIQGGGHSNNEDLETESEYTLFHVGNSSVEPLLISATVNSAELSMEVDTGATRSITVYKLTTASGPRRRHHQ